MVRKTIAAVSSDMNDSDYEGLLPGKAGSVESSSSTHNGGSTIAPLNLDHLTHRKQKMVSPDRSRTSRGGGGGKLSSKYNYYGQKMSFTEYCTSDISVMCHFYPKACGCFTVSILLTIMIFLASLIWNPTEEYGHIHHDHSNIKSTYDLSMGDIDHWCLGGGDDGCRCEDPLIPLNRVEYRSWAEAFIANRKMLKRFQDPFKSPVVDVAFLGESIVEELDGRWMGRGNRSPGMMNLERIFQSHFRKEAGASLEGVALGIAGDTAPNVLWRLMHGEMPSYFDPGVWWLVLGSNDLGRMQCSEEVVVLGILRVVEEILELRPNAKVVINSILPMTALRGGLYPVLSDYQDSFGRPINGHRFLNSDTIIQTHSVESGYYSESRNTNIGHRALIFGRNKKKDGPVVEGLPPQKMTEEEMAAAAQAEEEARDEQAKKEQQRSWLRQPANNPIMEDKEKIRKYELGRHFIHKAAQPLWTSIKAINRELRKFADKHDRVTFFDATSIFTEKEGKSYTLLTDLLTVRGHPTEQGFALWEDAIVEKLHKMLDIAKDDFRSSTNETQTAGENQPAEVTIIEDDVPEDDDLDDTVLHQNDDGFVTVAEKESPPTDETESDGGDEEESQDDGELFVPAPHRDEGNGG